jgi:hypothetical protein
VDGVKTTQDRRVKGRRVSTPGRRVVEGDEHSIVVAQREESGRATRNGKRPGQKLTLPTTLKRRKSSHTSFTLPPLPTLSPPPPASKPTNVIVEDNQNPKKRVLPVRQGHIDILDGEISLLSNAQRSLLLGPY